MACRLVALLSESTDPVRLRSSTEVEQQEGCAGSGRQRCLPVWSLQPLPDWPLRRLLAEVDILLTAETSVPPKLAALRGGRLEQQKHKCMCKASRSFPKGEKSRDREERRQRRMKTGKDELLPIVFLSALETSRAATQLQRSAAVVPPLSP